MAQKWSDTTFVRKLCWETWLNGWAHGGIWYMIYQRYVISDTGEIPACSDIPMVWAMPHRSSFWWRRLSPECFMNVKLTVMQFNETFSGQGQTIEITVFSDKGKGRSLVPTWSPSQHHGQRRTTTHVMTTPCATEMSQSIEAWPKLCFALCYWHIPAPDCGLRMILPLQS